MQSKRITGHWVYRSLLNTPDLVDDFNKVRFGEGTLILTATARGLLSGTFDFGENYQLDVTGTDTAGELRLRSVGRPGTPTAGWIYEHRGQLASHWEYGDSQVPAIVGTVLRSVTHDGRPAGLVGSFIAVSRDQVPTKNIDLLPDSVIQLVSHVDMRLHHTAWHLTRNSWGRLNVETRDAIAKLGWAVPRPSLEYSATGEQRRAINWNGAGEDFLFMHREMLIAFKQAMSDAGAQWQSWTTIPSPGRGPTVPPAWDNGDEEDTRRFAALKTDEFYWSRMRWWDEKFKDPTYLRTLTLGQLGAQIEWSVHNDMHMRWSGLPRDPVTNDPLPQGRLVDDFDEKWNRPNSDDLADFYSSHVNPIFYKLHGWVDDRIEDWFEAHERFTPGEVKRRIIGSTPWFEKGLWVEVEAPWSAPGGHHHGGHHEADNDHGHPTPMNPEVMKRVIGLVAHPIGASPLAVRDRPKNLARISAW
ncbi:MULTISPECIES: hypothetical protein [Corallococcus]|uniref:hypothetical protein n=1 Tax=Corallococcus TaxID=83461 RepID=UPI0011C3836B|nr:MULTISPECIES: hypothetical protein [Corallococcus]